MLSDALLDAVRLVRCMEYNEDRRCRPSTRKVTLAVKALDFARAFYSEDRCNSGFPNLNVKLQH